MADKDARRPGSLGDWDFGQDADLVAQFSENIAGVGRLGVAFSGGVDSTVLLALSSEVLGKASVVALLGVSPSLSSRERDAAKVVAAELGIRLIEVETAEIELPAYRKNGLDRCFFCKSELFDVIDREIVQKLGIDAVAYGENSDDLRRVDRPGSRAASEHGVLRPLATSGFDKAAVRRVARVLGLPNAEKPAEPCLASRIPFNSAVTRSKLRQIEAGESLLKELGFVELRVRHYEELARIELSSAEFEKAIQLRSRIVVGFRAIGFRFVTIDLAGLQSGTLSVLAQGD